MIKINHFEFNLFFSGSLWVFSNYETMFSLLSPVRSLFLTFFCFRENILKQNEKQNNNLNHNLNSEQIYLIRPIPLEIVFTPFLILNCSKRLTNIYKSSSSFSLHFLLALRFCTLSATVRFDIFHSILFAFYRSLSLSLAFTAR